MVLLKETTVWKNPTPNHVYIFDGSTNKIVGYVPSGKTVAVKFTKPIQFDRRGRTFVSAAKKWYDLSALGM